VSTSVNESDVKDDRTKQLPQTCVMTVPDMPARVPSGGNPKFGACTYIHHVY